MLFFWKWKQGHRMDLLTDTFWLMTFFESISLLGSQVLANLLTTDVQDRTPLALAAILAILGFLYIKRKWSKSQDTLVIWSYRKSFSSHVLRGKFFKYSMFFKWIIEEQWTQIYRKIKFICQNSWKKTSKLFTKKISLFLVEH